MTNTHKGSRAGRIFTVTAAVVGFVVMLGGVVLMAGALAPSTRPDIMTENVRGLLMLAGMCTLGTGAAGIAKVLEVR
jgi:hypothetical protein